MTVYYGYIRVPLDDAFVNKHFRLGAKSNIRDKVMTMCDQTIEEIVKSAYGVEIGQRAIGSLGATPALANDILGYVPPQNNTFEDKNPQNSVSANHNVSRKTIAHNTSSSKQTRDNGRL